MMKRFLMAVVAGAVVTSPAVAQRVVAVVTPWNPQAFWRGAPENPFDRIQFLQQRINRGLADGSLNGREASRANRELSGVRQWIHRMHWENGGQLGPVQRARVQARLDAISRQIRWMRHDGW